MKRVRPAFCPSRQGNSATRHFLKDRQYRKASRLDGQGRHTEPHLPPPPEDSRRWRIPPGSQAPSLPRAEYRSPRSWRERQGIEHRHKARLIHYHPDSRVPDVRSRDYAGLSREYRRRRPDNHDIQTQLIESSRILKHHLNVLVLCLAAEQQDVRRVTSARIGKFASVESQRRICS